MTTTILNAIKAHLETDRPASHGVPAYTAVDLAAILTGGIWTRDLRPWREGEQTAPGNTSAAFDSRGRIKPVLSITAAPTNMGVELGPEGAYWEQPELYLRCLPQATEKAKIEQAIHLMHVAFRHATILGAQGEGLHLRVTAQIGPYDDAIIQNAVLYLVRVQVDSVWKL